MLVLVLLIFLFVSVVGVIGLVVLIGWFSLVSFRILLLVLFRLMCFSVENSWVVNGKGWLFVFI